MMNFFIDLYENIIEIYNHLDLDAQPSAASKKDNNLSSHYIITIQEPYTTYDNLLNVHAPYSLKQLAAEMHTVIPIAQPCQQYVHSTSCQASPTTSPISPTPTTSPTCSASSASKYEDVNLEESTMNMVLNNRIFDDYCIVPKAKHHDDDEDWEVIVSEV
jgi:hypothetical protein